MRTATEPRAGAIEVVSGHFEALTRGGSMATACITHSALKVHGISKPIIARFDQPQASSDGGAILIKAVDDRLGLTWRLASVIRDHRQPGKITHPLRDLLRQRSEEHTSELQSRSDLVC